MYSKYKSERGKNNYPKFFEVAENENDYVFNDINIKTYTLAFKSRIHHGMEDDENMKYVKGLEQDIKKLGTPNRFYFKNNDDDNGINDEFEQFSTYSSYKNNDFYKASDYLYKKLDYQYYQCRQSNYRYNKSDQIHQSFNLNNAYEVIYDNHEVPPYSVHPSSSDNYNSNNNNNDINSYKNNGGYFLGGHRQSLPTTEYPQLKSLDQSIGSIQNFVSEQHYQQYYSSFYNQRTPIEKLVGGKGRGRKLPITSKMPFPKKNVHAKLDLITVESNNVLDKTNLSENNTNAQTNFNYVLREKSTNNNDIENAFENGNWHYDSNLLVQMKFHERDYLKLKSFDNIYYDANSCCEEDSKVESLNLQQQNKRKLGTNSAECLENLCYDIQMRRGDHDAEEDVNDLEHYELNNIQSKPPISNEKGEIFKRHIKLPITPIKANKGTPVKKYSPSPKNRRVLIYNIQSPRLSRLSTSNTRLHRSKFKVYNDSKERSKSQDHVLNSLNPNKDLGKPVCDIIQYDDAKKSKDIFNGANNNDDDIISDDDDCIDNVSDFDSSGDSDISSDSEGYRSYAYKFTHSLDVASTSPSVESSINSDSESLKNPEALLVPSLFPNVPPYLAFSSSTKKGPDVPNDLYRILKWRVTNVMPRVVRFILANSGMRLLKKTNDWMGVWGKHMKSPCFKTIRPYQKINHLPGSFKIGRKDSCWKNLVKLMAKHGKKDFGFMPKTYIIPNDLKQLRKSWPKYAQKNVKWIIKPPASARGTGIRVVDRWAQIPKRKLLIVQKYIERPLLINGSKFDLRLYVLVTSINPLRVYMYHNGLARFASVKYSDKSDTLNDRCMHLTNYSINKFSSNYSKNEDVNACHGHKWTIKSLWTYLSSRGVRTDLLWAALRSLVLRTILAGENSINNMIRTNVESKYSCFELFGFDVLLDADLIPWLLEVNISPSLHSELPLDSHVKAPLVQSVLNTALYNIPPKIPIERQKEIAMEMSLPPGPICYDKRMYINYLSRTEKIKHNMFTRKSMDDREEYINPILEHLTPDDVRCLIIAEDELARCTPLERIFPTIDTYKYLKYTEAPRYYNRLLDAWESRYGNNRIEGIHLLRQYCEDQYHLQVPQIPTKKDFLAKFLRWILK
ncbi:tubulin tyrosine ligase-like 4A isoform 2-T2 [Cochliomyia hominivorax]